MQQVGQVRHVAALLDSAVDEPSFAPAETTKLHLVRFTNLCKRYAAQRAGQRAAG